MEPHAELLTLARSQPAPALKRIDAELQVWDGSDYALIRVLQAGGLAARLSGDLPRSNGYLRRAIQIATESEDETGLAEATITLAGNVFLAGKPARALEILDSFEEPDDQQLAARVGLQRGTIYARTTQFEAAVEALGQALDAAKRADNPRLVAVVTKNRGMLRVYSGDHHAATADLEFARDQFRTLGIDIEVAYCTHNLGLVALYSGDLPTSLRLLAEAEDEVERLAESEWELQVARCEALLTAGLADEAATTAADAARTMASADHALDRAEALLVGARAQILRGDSAEASRLALLAAGAFADQGRQAWSAHAQLIALETAKNDPASAAGVEQLATALAAGGLADAHLAAELAGARVLADSEPSQSEERIAALRSRLRRARLDQRLDAATTLAQARLRLGNWRGADAAARAAYDTILGAQAFLGQPDLRVGIALHGAQVGRIGLELALRSGKPRRVLMWLERIKTAIQQTAPTPKPDDRLREALTEYRSLNSAGFGVATAQRTRAERRIRNWSRARATQPSQWRPLPADEVLEAIGPTTLVEYGEHDGELIAVAAHQGRTKLHRLGHAAEAKRIMRQVRTALSLLATGAGDTAPHAELNALDDLLIAPLGDVGGAVVIAPTPALFGLPWGALARLSDRRTVIVPSATAWAVRRPATTRPRPTILARGPELETAAAELNEVAAAWPTVRVLDGERATVAATVAAMDGAPVAHVVAHGTNRIDNPLFSSLRMADGPLSVYELERVSVPPDTVVLSACHVGLAEAAPGRELLGLVGGLLGAGVRTVVASTLPLPDADSTVDFMTAFHESLADGAPPSAALLAAQATVADPRLSALYRGAIGVFGGD